METNTTNLLIIMELTTVKFVVPKDTEYDLLELLKLNENPDNIDFGSVITPVELLFTIRNLIRLLFSAESRLINRLNSITFSKGEFATI